MVFTCHISTIVPPQWEPIRPMGGGFSPLASIWSVSDSAKCQQAALNE